MIYNFLNTNIKVSTMKKFFMMMAMMVIPFAIQAQTKFHDVEANDATGPVKTIKSQMMGRDI